ncbi:hypothetical protein B0E43_22695, partial [Algoriphagus sp. A40]
MNLYFPLLCFYPSQAGGPANAVFWHSEALAKSGYSCKVTSTGLGISDIKSIEKNIYNSRNEITFVKGYMDFFSSKEIKKV